MEKKAESGDLLPLDLAMDYPINWSFPQVLRDFIQNFFDAIGPEKFETEFIYDWHQNADGDGFDLMMSTDHHPFSYEWLMYVGGSTKTASRGRYIGQYGEGFKMSVLRIMQMGGMTISMHALFIFPSRVISCRGMTGTGDMLRMRQHDRRFRKLSGN